MSEKRKSPRSSTKIKQFYPEVSDRLRAIRMYLNLTQKDFSKTIEVTISHVKSYEVHVVNASIQVIIKTAQKSMVSCDYILTGNKIFPIDALVAAYESN